MAKYDPKGIAIAGIIVGLTMLAGIIAIVVPEPSPSTATVAKAAQNPETKDAAFKPLYTGLTYPFSEAQALAQIAKVFPDVITAPPINTDRRTGESCALRDLHSGYLTICTHNDLVSLILFEDMSAEKDVRLTSKPVVDAFMSVFEDEPYTATDRKRIHREVREYLYLERSVIEKLETRRIVAMNMRWVMVENDGIGYQLIADPNVESVFDKTHLGDAL